MAAKLPSVALGRFLGLGRSRRVAVVASLVWAVLVLAYAVGFFAASQARGTAFLDAAFFLVTLALPVILIWLAAFLAEALERQRELIAALAEVVPPLHASLEATRDALERHAPAGVEAVHGAVHEAMRGWAPAGGDNRAAIARVLEGQRAIVARLDALADAAAAAREAPAAEAQAGGRKRRGSRAAAPAVAAAADGGGAGQPALPLLGPEAPEDALAWADLVRAFDFPRDAGDEEGFQALKRALRRRSLAQTLQAAEDVMTLLSQHGVFMEDLAFEPADAAAWRRFVAGGRDGGRDGAAADLGALADADAGAVETTRGLMKADPIFRDTALFFQRRFDGVLGELAEGASDADLADLADTRSGRAFRLMLSASGAAGQRRPQDAGSTGPSA